MTGMRVLPVTPATSAPAAALVLHHESMSRIDPMYRQLDSMPAVREVRLVPVTIFDFYSRERANGF